MGTVLASTDFIATKILFLRDEKVLLDADLALLYGVETKVLKQAVRRNILSKRSLPPRGLRVIPAVTPGERGVPFRETPL